MKICICTTPIRPTPTTFPPFGSMAIIQALRRIGESADFYNIDYFRYSHAQVEAHFSEHQYDIVGISAVVSTAYAYTKYLAQLIRRVSPRTSIVVGGNLAASAEILLNKCDVDFCVVGDGETVVQELFPLLQTRPFDFSRLGSVKGICFIENNGKFNFTGYGRAPDSDEIESPDYSILERDGSLDYFMPPVDQDRTGIPLELLKFFQPGKRLATVITAKGCVARCTFCHRWERGYRARPAGQLRDHLKLLKEQYNVGFIDVGDENFGSNHGQAAEIASGMKEHGMIWRVSGVRTRTITSDALGHWRNCGCTAVHFGIESGSPRMLRVMEKNTTVEQNVGALRTTNELGLETVIQLVIGMPGETDESISETLRFLKQVHPYMNRWNENTFPSDSISINYAQALPGTPLYEYAREGGYIGKTIDDEEKYLLRISDTDAYQADHFINYTGLPLLKVLLWRAIMIAELDAFHLRELRGEVRMSLLQLFRYYSGVLELKMRTGWRRPFGALFGLFGRTPDYVLRVEGQANYYIESGYFNIQSGLKYAPLLFNRVTRRLFRPIVGMSVALRNGNSVAGIIGLIGEQLMWSIRQRVRPTPLKLPDQSLRKAVVSVSTRNELAEDRMMPLRSGQ